MTVHNTEQCSKHIENVLVCTSCSKNDVVLEQSAVENWRNAAKVCSKKRTTKSYLEPTSELLYNSYDKFLNKVSPIGVMTNGNNCDLLPIKMEDGYFVVLRNTCGFDSLVQLLATAYCDSLGFKELISVNTSKVDVCHVVENLVKSGVTKKTYRLRAELLRKECTVYEEHPNKIVSIDVGDSIHNILKTLHLPCALKVLNCKCCGYTYESTLITVEVEVSVAHKSLNLENNLKNLVNERQLRRICTSCNQNLWLNTNLSFTHLFVEPLNEAQMNMELTIKLCDIPKYLNFNDTSYALRGIIGYTGPSDGQSLGHFTCMAYRHNQKWELYDDRMTKSCHCSPKREVRVQLILYTI